MHIDPSDVATCIADEIPAPSGDISVPTSVPIVQTSLFSFPDFQSLIDAFQSERANRVYTRGQNPTVEEVERKVALLERGEACKAFGSGMAAISAVFMGQLQAGDHILFANHIYGPTLQLARHLRRFGIEHDVCLDLDIANIERALTPATRLIWVESPGTMLFQQLDLRELVEMARARGVLTGIDNSWATPLLQKPLDLGLDFTVHTCTKYLGGHSDLLAGVLVTSAERMQEIFHRAYLLNGGVLAPFDAWLLLRGMRTLPARLRQHEADALQVARWLQGHPAVRAVHHPGLDADQRLSARQLSGFSGTFSFELKQDDFETVRTVIDRLRVFRIGVSWGGVESLVISPNRPGQSFRSRGIPDGLIRLSIGLEGADELQADLGHALRTLA